MLSPKQLSAGTETSRSDPKGPGDRVSQVPQGRGVTGRREGGRRAGFGTGQREELHSG